MNLSTKALESLDTSAYKNMGSITDFVTKNLTKAVKVAVPESNAIDINITLDIVNYIKMPHDVMAFEYEIPNAKKDSSLLAADNIETFKSSKRIALVCKYTCIPKGLLPTIIPNVSDDTIAITSIYFEDVTGYWHFAPGIAVFDPLTTTVLDINSEKYGFNANYLPYSEFLLSPTVTQFYKNPEVILRLVANDTADEVALAIKTIVALNTKNIKIITIPPSEKLNKKRLKNNKVPFFEYLTLDIFLSPEHVRKIRLNPTNLSNHLKSFTLTKLHSVKGHFKIRKTGIFFWNTFIRGGNKQK